MKPETRETFIWIFCIVILLLIAGRLLSRASTVDCRNCTVTFKDKLVFEDKLTDVAEVKIMDLFNAYKERGECLVWWDEVNGYGGLNEFIRNKSHTIPS